MYSLPFRRAFMSIFMYPKRNICILYSLFIDSGGEMAVPTGIPVEQSIKEIDAEIRMEDIRQSPAARLKMEHFHALIKKNLMDKKLNYEAEHRKEILEGLRHMKRRLPTEMGASLVKKLEILAVNLECTHRNENETFLMKSDDLTIYIHHNNDQAIGARIYYFGDEFPADNEIALKINDNEWDELRIAIQSMLRTVPCSAPKEMKQKLFRYRLSVERSVMSKWRGGASATISQVNESSVGWPAPPTTLRPMRVFLYGEPGVEFEMREKGITSIDAGKGEIPYAEIAIMESDKEKVFSCDGTSFSYSGIVKLELSCRWLLSAYTLDELKRLGARPVSVLQKTNLIRLMANCQMKEGDLELVGKELGRDVRYLVKGEDGRESEDVIVESLVLDGERLEEVFLVLHHQAVFNSSWESIVASCCVKHPSTLRSIQFEMNTRGCNWEIVFTGDGSIYHVRLNPSTTRHWTLNIFSHHNDKLSDLSDEIEGAFNGTWSLSKCLSYLVDRLGLSGSEWQADASMDTSLPLSDCSLQVKSKVGFAWLRKDIPPVPPPIKHEYRVVLPKGRCPLLRMMREVKPRKPLKVARARPQLSNPTVPPLRVNRLDAGLPPLQPHSTQTPFAHIENMVKGVDDVGRSANSPMGSMDGAIYGHTGYPAASIGGNRMGVGSSALVRGGVAGMGGGNPMPPYASPQQQEIMRQQLMRQQSTGSMLNQGVFEFQDDSRGSSPSSVNDFSPGYSNQYPGYAPPQSPLVRGGGTTKTRRPRGRKAGNVGDRTPGSSIDSPSSSGVSPDNKRPKSGPGSRGGRGGRGKRGISMDQSMSPFQRSLSEMSNSMSSPLAASVTPIYSQQSFDEGTSDEECDPPPFSRSLSSVTCTSATTVVASSRLSSTPSSSSPLATPVSQPLPSSPIISVVPSPLVPTSSTPTLVSVLSAPSQTPPVSSSLPLTVPSSLPSSLPPSLLPSIVSSLPSTSASSSPHSSIGSSVVPSLVKRKSSLESIVGQLANQSKKRALGGPASDLFDTGLEDTSLQSSSTSTAPVLYPEAKIESPKKEGTEEKIVLKLKAKSAKEQKKKKENPDKEKNAEKEKEKEKEKDKEKEKKKEDKPTKSGEDRKRKADSSSKEKKEKEAKKAKIVDPPLIGANEHVTKMGMLKGFKIPKTKGPGDLSIASSSSSSSHVPALPSPSLIVKPTLATPPMAFPSQSKGGSSQTERGPPPPFRLPAGGPIKGSVGGRQPSSRPPKSILKSSPGPPSGGPRNFLPERKASHPPYHEPPRTRQPSGGSGYPPSHTPSTRRPILPKGIPPPTNNPNWVPIRGGPLLPPPFPSTSIDGPPTLTPAISGPNLSSRLDRPPTLEPSRTIIPDSPASPDGLHIVDE